MFVFVVNTLDCVRRYYRHVKGKSYKCVVQKKRIGKFDLCTPLNTKFTLYPKVNV